MTSPPDGAVGGNRSSEPLASRAPSSKPLASRAPSSEPLASPSRSSESPASPAPTGGSGPAPHWSERLRARLTEPGRTTARAWPGWLTLALAVGTLYGLPNLRKAFSEPYVVQDDARQHVFWMERFRDPGLFPGDPIADYFQAVAPEGYEALYRVAAAMGWDPLLFSKLLPITLAWVTIGYGFALGRRLLDSPAAAFLAAAFLAQSVWLTDDLPSGTPRAFAVPLAVVFLYYLSRRALIPCLATLFAQGLVYPQALLVSCVTLALVPLRWDAGRARLSQDRRELAFCALGLAAGGLSVLPFALGSSDYGPVLTAEQARRLPEFWPPGRSEFFGFNPWKFWIESQRSGLFPKFFSSGGPFLFVSIALLGGFLLPRMLRRPERWPLARFVSPGVGLLARFGVASLLLFAAAHATLFRLHLPSRYSGLGAHVVLSFAAALVLTLALDAGLRGIEARATGPRPRANEGPGARPAPTTPLSKVTRIRAGGIPKRFAVSVGLVAALLVWPVFHKAEGDYVIGRTPELYGFLARQPVDARVAGLSSEASNLPAFARRSVIVSREVLIPYHTGYFRDVRQRALDLLRAQYAEDPGTLDSYVRRYEPDFFLVDRDAFTAAYARESWISQFQPLMGAIERRLAAGSVPALARVVERCVVLEEGRVVLVDAGCAVSAARGEGSP